MTVSSNQIREHIRKASLGGNSNTKYLMLSEIVNKKVHMEIRLPHTRWVVLRYPSQTMAHMASMSEEAFEDWYFQVCTMDYAKMSVAMDSLVAAMAKTDRVGSSWPT